MSEQKKPQAGPRKFSGRPPQRGGRRNRPDPRRQMEGPSLDDWKPRTLLGMKVKNKEITDIDEILDKGLRIYEQEIVDTLLPNLDIELLLVGQSKGKFGGGQRRAFRQTQKKTKEGNKPHFLTIAVVGNGNGYVGVGIGKSKETVPAREKATRNSKLNIIKIMRGSGSWEGKSEQPLTVPFEVIGKCGSVVTSLKPAPKGTGLKAQKEIAKILTKAGITDVWAKSRGQTSSRVNLIMSCFIALKNTMKMHTLPAHKEILHLCEGKEVKNE